MMARIVGATLAGAVVYFVWGMLAWMVLPIHDSTVHALPNEQALIDTLRSQDLESGVYIAPFTTDPESMSDPESEFMKNHQAGPIFSIYLRKEGTQPMSGGMILCGFIIDLAAAALAVCLLSSLGSCGKSYACRVGFVAGLGVFAAIVGHLSYWNWMYFPMDYTIAFFADVAIGWTLAGLAIAALVKPNSGAETSLVTPTNTTNSSTTTAKPTSDPAVESQEQAAAKVPAPSKPALSKPAAPTKPVRNDAISLLAALQREARFVDIVKEPLGEYSDAQVGAAARDVLRDCGAVIDRLFKVEPILKEDDGATVQIPSGADAAKIKVTGNASGGATSGTLVHHGWQAQQCELPTWTGSKELAMVLAQAEVESK